MAFFDPSRPAYLEDPYPALARLRREEPVHYSRSMAAWVLTSYRDCVSVLQDESTFSSDLTNARGEAGEAFESRRRNAPLGNVPVLSNSDPPAHTRLREVVSRSFTPRALERMRPLANEHAATLVVEASTPLDVVGEVARPLVTGIILDQLGIPAADQERFRLLAMAIIAAHSGDARLTRAAGAAHDELDRLAQQWEGSGQIEGASVLGTILEHGGEGKTSRDEMLMLLINIALSGNGATIFGIGNAVKTLAEQRDALEAVCREDLEFGAAIDELLRFDSPAHIVSRVVREPAELGARRLHTGDIVHVVLGAANRDPAAFVRPDELDFDRDGQGPALTFGYGSHFCLGAPLARIQTEAVLRALFERFGAFRILDIERERSILMRGPARLLVGPEG